MRILSVLTQKPFGTGSGAYMTGIIHALQEAGHEQAVVGGIMQGEEMPWDGSNGIAAYPMYYGTEEVPFPVVGMSDQMPYVSTLYRNLDVQMEAQLKGAFHRVLTQAVQEFQPDLIVCHHLYLLTAWVRSWFPEHKVYGVCHGSDLRQYRQTAMWRDFISEQIRKLDRVYALHDVQRQQIEELHGCENVRILGSAINQQVFRRESEADAELTAWIRSVTEDETQKTLVYVGKLSRSKGVLSLLSSLQYLPFDKRELRVVLAGGPGNPEEMQEVEEQIRTCRYEVVRTGMIRPIQVAELNRHADCFVLPSFYEGLPLVIFEARACGAPVVCTDLPGVRNWADAHVPGHAISFVSMPPMVSADEPDPQEVPDFEQRMARALEGKLLAGRMAEPNPDLTGLTWQAVAHRLICAE